MSKSANNKLHYKMYKSGKSWVFAGILSAGLLLAGGGTVASADTTPTSTPTTENVTPQAENVQNDTPSETPTSDEKAPEADPAVTEPKAETLTSPEKPETPAPSKTSTPAPQTPSVHTPEVQDPTAPKQPAPVTTPGTPEEPATNPAPEQTTAPMMASLNVPADTSIDTWMPNKTLQNMVAKALGKDVSQITQDEMTGLTSLASGHTLGDTVYVDGKTPFSLEGLQYATNLTSLDLSYDPSFEYIKLQMSPNGSGDLGDITDLTPLSALTKLTTLNVANNKIVSLAPLAGLKNLTNLDVTHNRIGDFSMLDANQFTSLKIGHQVFVVDYAQQKYVDPTTHAITIAQPLQLPQNYSGKLQMPFMGFGGELEGFDLVQIKLQQIHLSNGEQPMVFLLYKSGNLSSKYTLNADNSLSFTNIAPQSTYYYGNSYDLYPNSVGTPTPGNHKYYLRANLQGKLGDSFTVLIPYANATAAAPVTVQYRDEADDTTAIKDDLVLGADQMAGDTYTLTPDQLAVDGYTYDDDRNQGAALTGTLSDQAQTITLYYKKDATNPVTPVTPPVTPAATVTVTVHYQDEQGNTVLQDAYLTGSAGDTYQVETPAMDNYQLVSAAYPTGTFGTSDQDITVTYHKLSTGGDGATISKEKPTTKGQPDTVTSKQQNTTTKTRPATSRTSGQAATVKLATHSTGAAAKVAVNRSADNVRQSAVKSSETLPQTNEHRTAPILGLALLLSTLVGFGLHRKRN
ncbi:MucBP domain-containing protein [Levilactobacillus tujiorum]|uniref:KxYKxGKxW signal peptide domain-containing protein n=1 Tax=Levilactobacillus tujiorum TaxID=2912243 RepID=A0ABX1L463_9LACO|nr:MucBP domain-containing protein [Levilactobacillus tujiorum]MCH5464145.1 MucBP domain-containing protein [Levilactobacillus tujiorum]NLR11244.1 KxYKxGKxW signal peptide domain-containing protein [Lactobacillus sp. HBUAS51387]NLR29129.1 KxYKxGKxW signal peptide domain-containing protein [Levilactobacillus tujiorum]